MAIPLSQRLFGITTDDPTSTVQGLVERLREETPEGHERVIVAQRNDTVADAFKLFQSFQLHHLPVVDGRTVVGVVSSTDLMHFFAREGQTDPTVAPLEEVMTPKPHVVMKDAPIREVIRILAHSKFRCVPVITDGGDLGHRDHTRLGALSRARVRELSAAMG